MEKLPPYLTLVDPAANDPQADEFIPLPYYPWDERPSTLALDHDECATAIHLAHGSLQQAANLLKVPLHRLSRSVRSSPRLQKVQSEGLSLSVERAASKLIDALDDGEWVTNAETGERTFFPNHRRQEWAVNKLLASRAAMGHPLSPAPANSIQSNASLTLSQQGAQKSVTFRWKTADDAMTTLESDDLSNSDG